MSLIIAIVHQIDILSHLYGEQEKKRGVKKKVDVLVTIVKIQKSNHFFWVRSLSEVARGESTTN